MKSHIMIEEYDDKIDFDFMQQIARPYFKDIFNDVAMRSVSPIEKSKKDSGAQD